MPKPLVSIMMPVYNGLPLIKASVESIMNQSYPNWECVMVDDGSTDGTSDYIDSLNDDRFVINHLKENSGRAVARQEALNLCKGKYICMVDAEDLIHPKKIAVQVEFMESNPDYSLCTTAICSFGVNTRMLLVRGADLNGEVMFTGANHPIHAASIYRASIAKRCQYNPSLRLGEDQDFLEKYLKNNPRYYAIPRVLYYYSELDSVSKEKISNNYCLYIKKYLDQKNYKMSLLFLLKYFYSKMVFPFVSIESILCKRGRNATDKEVEDFNNYCRPIVDKYAGDNKKS